MAGNTICLVRVVDRMIYFSPDLLHQSSDLNFARDSGPRVRLQYVMHTCVHIFAVLGLNTYTLKIRFVLVIPSSGFGTLNKFYCTRLSVHELA